jgi:glucan 1,3-beta-glucosidase
MTGFIRLILNNYRPAGFYGGAVLNVVRQYWYDSYGNIRSFLARFIVSHNNLLSSISPRYPYGSSRQSDIFVLIHDAFMPLSYWKGFETPLSFEGVAMDTHLYQMFSYEVCHFINVSLFNIYMHRQGVARNQTQHIQNSCRHASSLSTFDLLVLVGEWTPVMTDCAKYLNGRGIGSRFDGTYRGSHLVGNCTGLTGNASTFSSEYQTFLRQSWEAQVITYEKGAGWIQWTWKTESTDEWSYQAGLAYGWIPLDPTNLQYPTICD